MIKRWALAGLIFCAACGAGGKVVTLDEFYSVSVGTSREELIQQLGRPYSIRTNPNGQEELEYIERIQAGDRLLEQRSYIYIIENGKVASKRLERKSPAPWRFDSYEMQTTQNEGEESP